MKDIANQIGETLKKPLIKYGLPLITAGSLFLAATNIDGPEGVPMKTELKITTDSTKTIYTLISREITKEQGFYDFDYRYFSRSVDVTKEQADIVMGVSNPKAVPDLTDYGFSLKPLLQARLMAFIDEPRSYEYSEEVAVGYGLLGGANFAETFMSKFSRGKRVVHDDFEDDPNHFTKLKSAVHSLMSTPSHRKTLFNWVEPIYVKTFLTLDKKSQDIYSDILTHTKNYLENFDYNKESEFLKECKKQGERNDFTNENPEGEYEKYRKMEAWCFRRIHNDGVPKKELLEYINQIEKDLYMSEK